MNYQIDIQHACDEKIPVADEILIHWAKLALETQLNSAELSLRLVDLEEMTHLNGTYRHKHRPTNVLAFPTDLPKNIELAPPLLGDVVVCPAILRQESQSSNQSLTAHWAHMVIHGVLHLLGYEHVHEEDTNIMQSLEIQLLSQLGFEDPYQEGDKIE